MTTTNTPPAYGDEALMAFADGELDAAQRAGVERALQADPALRERVAKMVQQRALVGAAFSSVLDEPVPDRLTRLLRATPMVNSAVAPAASAVVNFADRRADRARMRSSPTWAQLGGMAASVLLGVLLGFLLGSHSMDNGPEPAMALHDGQLVAGGAVDKALSTQLASDPPARASVSVQLSFVAKSGNYCRTFSTAAVAGLACQQAGHWTVQQVAALEAAPPTGAMRQATTALPPALLEAVERHMGSGALDGAAERAALAKAWKN